MNSINNNIFVSILLSGIGFYLVCRTFFLRAKKHPGEFLEKVYIVMGLFLALGWALWVIGVLTNR